MADFKLADKLFPEEESLPLKPEGRSCAGLVLIAHGYNLKIIGEPNWTVSMQKAIYRRLRSNGKMGKIEVTGNKKNLKINCKWFEATGTGKSDSDIILRLDWSDVANYLVSGISTRQIAARI